ncbi:MAG: hypothetical protein Q4E03_03995 [Trueperella sp.]|nr:hypothetical protein [Trueperella sp.]
MDSNRIVNIRGTITSIEYPGWGTQPEVKVMLRTGSGDYLLRFQSRRNVECLEIGQVLSATGAVINRDAAATIYNPSYIIEAEI